MAAVMVMRALGALRLLLQRCQRLLRLADIARLQGVADLADGLRERAAALARLRLGEGGIGALRGGQVAGLQRADQLRESLDVYKRQDPLHIVAGRAFDFHVTSVPPVDFDAAR